MEQLISERGVPMEAIDLPVEARDRLAIKVVYPGVSPEQRARGVITNPTRDQRIFLCRPLFGWLFCGWCGALGTFERWAKLIRRCPNCGSRPA